MYILTSKCASRHNRVHFFISHLASWLRTRRFSEPTFRPSGATNHWNNTMFRGFPTFRAPGSSFFSDFLFFDLLSSCLLFSDSSHLCFSFANIVGSLTSYKLPSVHNKFQKVYFQKMLLDPSLPGYNGGYTVSTVPMYEYRAHVPYPPYPLYVPS